MPWILFDYIEIRKHNVFNIVQQQVQYCVKGYDLDNRSKHQTSNIQ